MPLFKTQLGEVNLCFKDFISFSNFLNGYYKALTEPIQITSTPQDMPLIGLDGNVTNDDSFFANRQRIICSFLMMKDAYVKEYGVTSIDKYYDVNVDKILSHSAVFNRLFSDFNDEYSRYEELGPSLDFDLRRHHYLHSNNQNDTPEAVKLNNKIKYEILECLRLCEKMKRILAAAQEYNFELVLFKLMTGFLRDGLDFFSEEELFEDVNQDRLVTMYDNFQSCVTEVQKLICIQRS